MGTDIILAFLVGAIVGAIALVVVACAFANKNDQQNL